MVWIGTGDPIFWHSTRAGQGVYESGKPIAEALRIEQRRFYRARIDGTIEPL